jgi:hypothetical protein
MRLCIYMFCVTTVFQLNVQQTYHLTADRVFDGEVMHEG